MRRSYVVDDKNYIGWYSGKFLHIKDTWVRATHNRIGIVRHGDSSKDNDAQLTEVENDGEEEM